MILVVVVVAMMTSKMTVMNDNDNEDNNDGATTNQINVPFKQILPPPLFFFCIASCPTLLTIYYI